MFACVLTLQIREMLQPIYEEEVANGEERWMVHQKKPDPEP